MVLHAKLLAPRWLSAGALVEVAALRMHNAAVAGRELLKTGIAKSLIEALIGFARAIDAENGTAEF